jgi:hypothetical protein
LDPRGTRAELRSCRLGEHACEPAHQAAFTEDSTEEATARRLEVPNDAVGAACLLDQHLARRQVPNMIVRVHHRVGGTGDRGGVRVGGALDSMVRELACKAVEDMALVDTAREVEPGTHDEPYGLGPRAGGDLGQTDTLPVPVSAEPDASAHP